MSYEAMEAKLVKSIAELHAAEDALMRSYESFSSVPEASAAYSMQAQIASIQARSRDIESLIARMETAPAQAPVAAFARPVSFDMFSACQA